MELKKNKTERKRSVSAFKDTIPFYVSLGMFFSGHKNRTQKYSSFRVCLYGFPCEIGKRRRFVSQTQTTVFAFQVTARHPGAQFLAEVLESLSVGGCAPGPGGSGGWGHHPLCTGRLSTPCGCHAAGGAAVMFISVQGSH